MTDTRARYDEVEVVRAPLSSRQAALWAIGVAGYLVAAWLLVQRGLVNWLANYPALNFYLAQPAIWLGLAWLSYRGWQRLPGRPPFSRVLTAIASLLAALHVGFLVFGGIILGFGQSYVAGQIANYPRNLWFVATWLLGLEMARAFVFHAWRVHSERWAMVGTTGLLALAMTPYGQVRGLMDAETLVNTAFGFVVPILVLNALLTWLTEHGGPGPAIGYSAVLLAFEWFSQVQPDLEWQALLVIGVTAPIVSARFIREIYLDTDEGAARWAHDDTEDDYEPDEVTRSGVLGWLAVGAFVALVVVAALLGYRPAVVNGISMEPAYEPGDLAIIDRGVDPASLAVGDVIEFLNPDNRSVIHRIVAIEEDPTGRVFTTRGDNNSRPDRSIGADRIAGKVVFLIPLLGWPAIWLRGG